MGNFIWDGFEEAAEKSQGKPTPGPTAAPYAIPPELQPKDDRDKIGDTDKVVAKFTENLLVIRGEPDGSWTCRMVYVDGAVDERYDAKTRENLMQRVAMDMLRSPPNGGMTDDLAAEVEKAKKWTGA